ncbi:MAG: CRTAC1 family protein, partial [Holophagales bacterium]|nr:CRTAC1 family protein [Holophagales bacterium]
HYGNRLYRNLGDGTFADVTDAAGVSSGGWGWGSSFADFDNDGILDLLHVNGWDVLPYAVDLTRLFMGSPSGAFSEESALRGLVDDRQGRGVSCFDSDRDGDLDIFISNSQDSPGFYRNDGGNANASITVGLRGFAPNSEGVGARVEMEPASGPALMRTIRAGSNYVSQDPARAHFGLGPGGTVRELRVSWPALAGEPRRDTKVVAPGAVHELWVEQSAILTDGFETGDLRAWTSSP